MLESEQAPNWLQIKRTMSPFHKEGGRVDFLKFIIIASGYFIITTTNFRRDQTIVKAFYRSHALRHCPQLRKNYYKANAYVDKSPLTPLYKGGGFLKFTT